MNRQHAVRPIVLLFPLLLIACSTLNEITPTLTAQPVAPAVPIPITSEYRCAGGKKLYVRYRDDGGQAWVLLPDREIMLNRIPSQISSRYTNGTATLDAKGLEATLATGTGMAYTECKIGK